MNKNNNLLILGAGQFGRVAKEVAESMGRFDRIAFLDDNSDQAIGKLEDHEKFVADFSYAFVAIGNSDLRLKYIEELEEACFAIAVLVSPEAHVSPSAQLMKGTIVAPGAVVNANSTVAVGCFVCAGAIVDHNSFVATVVSSIAAASSVLMRYCLQKQSWNITKYSIKIERR